MAKRGVSVVIPCLNEAGTIGQAVDEAFCGIEAAGLPGEVLVADNGSTDGSISIAQQQGARVVDVPERGYGAALHHGICSASFDYVVFADADMSYPFIEISSLIQPLLEGRSNFVLGSRLLGKMEKGAMPLLNRHLGTPVLSFFIRLLYGLELSDCNSGMRAFPRSIYPGLNLRCPGMEYASEMLIRIAQRKISYLEVPIGFRKDRRGHAPHMKRWRDGWRHLRFIIGNAPSLITILIPTLLSVLLLIFAASLSLTNYWAPGSHLRFHSAFIAIALAVPFALFASASLLLKGALHVSGLNESRLIAALVRVNDNAAPFYAAAGFFGCAFAEAIWLCIEWQRAGFGEFFQMGPLIRIMIYTFVASACFSVDLGLGIIRLTALSSKRLDPSQSQPFADGSGDEIPRKIAAG